MNIKEFIPESVQRSAARQALKLKKNRPHIMFGLGLGSMVTSTVLACRATLKLEKCLDEFHEELEENREDATGRDMVYIYSKHIGQIVKLYAPAGILGVTGVALLTKSHMEMTQRNAALAAAYAGLHKTVQAYRDKVREEIGVDKEQELWMHVERSTELNSDGEPYIKKTIDPNKFGGFTRCFDETNPEWRKDAVYNKMFIQARQNWFNNLLSVRGHVWLNEVYESLGFEQTREASMLGWVKGGDGDNFIDFGIYEAYNSQFVNGEERSIWLDFNVDGVINDKI